MVALLNRWIVLAQVWNQSADLKLKPGAVLMFRMKHSGILSTTTVGECKARLHCCSSRMPCPAT